MVATKKQKSLELFGTTKKIPDIKTIWHNTANINGTKDLGENSQKSILNVIRKF